MRGQWLEGIDRAHVIERLPLPPTSHMAACASTSASSLSGPATLSSRSSRQWSEDTVRVTQTPRLQCRTVSDGTVVAVCSATAGLALFSRAHVLTEPSVELGGFDVQDPETLREGDEDTDGATDDDDDDDSGGGGDHTDVSDSDGGRGS